MKREISGEVICQISQMLHDGHRRSHIARELGLSKSFVTKVWEGLGYRYEDQDLSPDEMRKKRIWLEKNWRFKYEPTKKKEPRKKSNFRTPYHPNGF